MADTAALIGILGIDASSLTGDTLTNFNQIASAIDAGTITQADVQTQANVVTSQYYNGLDRATDAGGMVFWTNGLLNNGLTSAQLEAGFDASTEGQIIDIYHSLLGRARDDSGLTFWMNSLEGGQSIESIRSNFTSSEEYTNVILPKFGANGVENFIYGVLPNQIYTAQDGKQDLFLIDAANVDGATLTGFSLSEGDIVRTGSSVASISIAADTSNSANTIITVTRTNSSTETVTIVGVTATDITSTNVSSYFLGTSSSVSGAGIPP